MARKIPNDFIAPSFHMVIPKVKEIENEYITSFNNLNKAEVLYNTLKGKINKNNEMELRLNVVRMRNILRRIEKETENCPCCNKCKRMNRWCSDDCAKLAEYWVSINSHLYIQ